MEAKLVKRHIVGYDLSIEKDSGCPVRILMGGTKEAQEQNWRVLRDLACRALARLDHPSLEDVPEDESLPLGGRQG